MNKILQKSICKGTFVLCLFICLYLNGFSQPSFGDLEIRKIYFMDSITENIDTTTFVVKFFRIPSADNLWEDSTHGDSRIIDSNYVKVHHIIGWPATAIVFFHKYGDEILLIYFKSQLMSIRLNDMDGYEDYIFRDIPFRSGNFKIDSLSSLKKLYHNKIRIPQLDITPTNWDAIKH